MAAKQRSKPKRKMNSLSHIKRNPVAMQFIKLFVEPMFPHMIVKGGDSDELLGAKLDLWFDAKHREVILFRAKKDFKVVGPRWHSPSTPEKFMVNGAGDRDISAGEAVWVRFDARNLNFVDFEFRDQVYRVRMLDFEAIQGNLEELC